MARVSLNIIKDFLAQKRIAIVGISRDEKEISGMLFHDLTRRGYEIVPVNPNASEIAGHRCFSRVQDVHPSADAVLIMTSPAISETVVHDCAEAGIKRVWLYGLKGESGVNANALAFCRQSGMSVVPGECPFMFLPRNGFHGLHGFIRKITGQYPRRQKTA